MNKKRLVFAVVFLTLTAVYTLFAHKVGSSIKMEVDKETGSISWTAAEVKATTGIRWQTKGYFLTLEPSKAGEFGYPLKKKSPKIKLYVDGINTSVETLETAGLQYTVKMTVVGDYIKDRITADEAFYKALLKNYKKGNKKLYLDAFFETYEVVTDVNIKKRIMDLYRNRTKEELRTHEGRYFYLDGRKYTYDTRDKLVKRIRKEDLTDIEKIREAEPWGESTKRQWLNNNYYDHAIDYVIDSNTVVKYVDESGRLIGAATTYKFSDGSKVKAVSVENEKVFNPHYEYSKEGVDSKLIYNPGITREFGKEVRILLPKTLTVKKNNKKIRYELIESGYYKDKDATKQMNVLPGDRAGEQVFELGLKDSVVVGKYKKQDDITVAETDEVMEGELPYPEPRAVIGAGTIGQSEFDITEGIPSDEYYYKTVTTEEYLLKYKFKNVKGEKLYAVNSYINWNLRWTEEKKEGDKVKQVQRSRVERRDYTTTVKREFSYWVIDNLEVYTLAGAFVANQALSDSENIMLPRGYLPPRIDCIHNYSEEAHIKPPGETLRSINLGEQQFEGSSVPEYNPRSRVEAIVTDIIVNNDRLAIDGRLIMDDRRTAKTAPAPTEPEQKGRVTNPEVLYVFGSKIERQTANGVYESDGRVKYVLSKGIRSTGDTEIYFDIEEINQVTVHTPVICDYRIQDARKWCQLIKPDETRYQLVLEKEFDLEIITSGRHLDIKGYGSRDYSKYVQRKEVIFPFEVIQGGNIREAHTPITVYGNERFKLPMTVLEGKYEIILKTAALNCLPHYDMVEEEYANLNINNYVAENKISVEVSGRLIDFTLTGIKNSSLWKDYSNTFGAGARLASLPLITGDNSKFSNEGAFKRGYSAEFALTTIGNYYSEVYGVEMNLRFFLYDKESKHRREVDVYYESVSEEDGEVTGLVKVGSKKDRKNIHYIGEGEERTGLFTYDRVLLPRKLMEAGSNAYIQRWRGEYSLPERIHVCEKGFNLKGYLDADMAVYFDEDFWIKKGYLVVAADISALAGKEKKLSYINYENSRKGYFNNWHYESAGRRKISDKGEEISFEDGDLFVYDLEKNIWQERRADVKKVY